MTRLFHFSDNGDIDRFVPRPVGTRAQRPAGQEWLNGPLVWAIAQDHQQLYLFPRECPRIVMWATAATSAEDRKTWLAGAHSGVSAIAYIEDAWLARLERASIFRYELPNDTFMDIDDVGMHVSPTTVVPSSTHAITDLRAALGACGTALRTVASLGPLRAAWNSSLHVSGIRLRNAADAGLVPARGVP